MEPLHLTATELEDLAAEALSVSPCMDLGPCRGGRDYLQLAEGLAASICNEDLKEFVRDAVKEYFDVQRVELRRELATRVWRLRQEND